MTTTCAHTDCHQPTTGLSKYCRRHALEARAAWRQMIADKAAERSDRRARFAEILADCQHAAMKAGTLAAVQLRNTAPAFAVVNAQTGRQEGTMPDCYGSATVVVKPATSAFARFLKAEGIGQPSAYLKGLRIYYPIAYQSVTEAQARAFADTLDKHAAETGVRCYYFTTID